MQNFLSRIRWFFTGLRLFLPFVPRFIWIAIHKMKDSTVNYWKNSQLVVNEMTDSYTDDAMQKLATEYDTFVFWACYILASFLYLLGWLAMSWLTVEAFRLLASWIF
jgi:hypothetical protein